MRDTIWTGFVVVCLTATVFGSFAVAYAVYRRLILKGYWPIGAGAAVFALYACGFAWGMGYAQAESLAVVAPFGLPCLLVPVLLALPASKGRRRFGARKTYFPFRLVGLILFGCALVTAVAYLRNATMTDLGDATKAVIALVAIGASMFWLSARSRSSGLKEAISRDPRPHVLYLRAFRRDIDFFIPIAPDELLHLASDPGQKLLRQFAATTPLYNPSLSFEEFFATDIDARIGPFVALGSPEDYLPPVGAARMYARDDEWKERLAELAEAATLIVMEPDESANLAWELQHLRQTGLHRKLVVITRPASAYLTKWSFVHWTFKFIRWARGVREVDWPAFVARMNEYGYAMNPKVPPCGSLFGFDPLGNAVLLTTDAVDPDGYVASMASWAQDRMAIGRNLALACARCGNACYDYANERQSLQPALCTPCKEGLGDEGLDAMRRLGRRIMKYPMLFWLWFVGTTAAWLVVAVTAGPLLSALLPDWLMATLMAVLLFGLWLLPVWWPRSTRSSRPSAGVPPTAQWRPNQAHETPGRSSASPGQAGVATDRDR